MAPKRYDPDEAEFDARYQRWLAALESGEEAELLEATAAIPTLDSRVLDKFLAVQSDDPWKAWAAGDGAAPDRAAQ
ncbi:MAG: hypothetical protein ACOYEV_17265 [Candidatus Nanopelagicales bacterium]